MKNATPLSHPVYSALVTCCRVGGSGRLPVAGKRELAAWDALVRLGAATRAINEARYTATPEAAAILRADNDLPGRRPSK